MTAPSRDGTEGANRSGASPNLMPEGLPSEDASRRQPTDGQDAGRPELGKGETKDAELLECGCHTMEGRALVVCLDGTSNQFGENNTNVIELYDRIIKDKKQLTYYNSGIGTYAKPSWRSFGYWRQVVSNKIDTAIAWNFEKILLGAYRWLSANYEEADRIYLFGFSRGAYQVRALAGMIEKVGLILPGNEEQIPFAYQLYADHKSDKYKNRALRFKDTFSRKSRSGVRVHYLGVWDTVSSIGVARSKSLPLTDTCDHFCYMRHALALDERRVKFQPEYARGGESWGKNEARVQDKPKSRPRVKEVWFAGSHSDINTELNNAAIPAMWMGNEAAAAGLSLSRSRAVWDVKELRKDRPKNSLSIGWRVLEVYPFKQLSYKDLDSTHRYFPCRLAPSNLLRSYLGDGTSQAHGSSSQVRRFTLLLLLRALGTIRRQNSRRAGRKTGIKL
ncbi:hypothetical protein BD779DRAFT_1632606 [Infundibulicybe gibba]|nr:hypothetical protein BD779DRAFT_1632606 [Infundibulicybe gibba]